MVNSAKKCLWILLISFVGSVSAQTTEPEVDPQPEIDPPPVRTDESEENGNEVPDNGPGNGTEIEGDLNTSNSNNNNVTKTFNGAGSRSMPASTAIAPSLMSNGTQSCLKSISGGVQLVGIGLSSGMYRQDEECNDTEKTVMFTKSIFIAVPASYLFFVPFFFAKSFNMNFFIIYIAGLILLIGGYFIHRYIVNLI